MRLASALIRAALVLCVTPATAIQPATSTLATVRRVFVESLGDSKQAVMLRDMVIASLARSGLVAVTEDKDRADALIRGSADDQIFTEQHSSNDNISAGIHSGTSSNFSDRYDHTSTANQSGLNIGQNESMHDSERKHEAAVSIRMVNREGDVIWSVTQESMGAKFKSASADVADRVLLRLVQDIQKARSGMASAATQAGMPTR